MTCELVSSCIYMNKAKVIWSLDLIYVGPINGKNQYPKMGSRKDQEPKQAGVKGSSDAP